MIQARHAGNVWSEAVGRRLRGARAVIVALPLLLLTILAGHDSAPTPARGGGGRNIAADAGAEHHALPARRGIALLGETAVKAKPPRDVTPLPDSVVPVTVSMEWPVRLHAVASDRARAPAAEGAEPAFRSRAPPASLA